MWRLPAASTCRLGQPSVVFPSAQRRHVTSFIDRFTSSVSRRVLSAMEMHMMPPSEQCITERRRPYLRRPSMQENLAERLNVQQMLRAHLIPSQVIVSKDKLYIDLVWPATALAAATGQQQGRRATAPSHEEEGSESAVAGDRERATKPQLGEHRSRFLAEFLRAYSPSTDVIGADALIYGRRGITIKDVIPVGNYALRIVFSDGHTGGIYPYEYIFHLGRHKYTRMREYIRRLREKRKSRDPPKRAQSQRLRSGRHAAEGTQNARVHSSEEKRTYATEPQIPGVIQ